MSDTTPKTKVLPQLSRRALIAGAGAIGLAAPFVFATRRGLAGPTAAGLSD